MDSYEKSLQTLELPAVLALLAAQAVSETARAQRHGPAPERRPRRGGDPPR